MDGLRCCKINAAQELVQIISSSLCGALSQPDAKFF
jgi:hypothetical protein